MRKIRVKERALLHAAKIQSPSTRAAAREAYKAGWTHAKRDAREQGFALGRLHRLIRLDPARITPKGKGK